MIRIVEEGMSGCNELPLAFGVDAELLGAGNFLPAFAQILCIGRRPQLVPIGHRRPPVSHGARRVGLGDIEKGLFRGVVCEGMQQSDRTLEVMSHAGRTGSRERDRAEPLRRRMRMLLLAANLPDTDPTQIATETAILSS